MLDPINKSDLNESRNPSIYADAKTKVKYDEYSNPQSKEPNKEKIFFSRMVDLFLLAAVYGFKEGLRKPLASGENRQELFKWTTFNKEDILLIKTISLLEANKLEDSNPNIIDSKIEMVTIVQEYANGGFEALMEKIEESPDIEKNYMDLLVHELEE
jgi:dnd system-associated protein 4